MDERLTVGLRSLRRSLIGSVAVTVVALAVTVVLVGSARTKERVHQSGRIGTAIVTAVHYGSKTNTAKAVLESPEGTQRLSVDVRRGYVLTGQPLQVRYLPHVTYAEAVGPLRPAGSSFVQVFMPPLSMLLLAIAFGALAFSYRRHLRRFQAVVANAGAPVSMPVTYRKVRAGRSVRWYAELPVDGTLTLRLNRRPKPPPDSGEAEPAEVWGDVAPGGYVVISPLSGRVVSPATELRVDRRRSFARVPVAQMAAIVGVLIGLLLLSVLRP